MVNITNANQPQWRTVTVRSHIPTVLKPLDEMAHNLWFCWNQEALELFKSLDAKIWSEVQQNPASTSSSATIWTSPSAPTVPA